MGTRVWACGAALGLGMAVLAAGGCALHRAGGGTASGAERVVLVGHGAIPKDLPKDKLARFFASHSHGHEHGPRDAEAEALEREICEWPRTAENDPYQHGLSQVARELERASGRPVTVAYNEFCDPGVGRAIDEAVASGASRVTVLSIMVTPGGGHSEHDIAESVERARGEHPGVEIVYAWPYENDLLASALAEQIEAFGTP